jgi:hypothetical protein
MSMRLTIEMNIHRRHAARRGRAGSGEARLFTQEWMAPADRTAVQMIDTIVEEHDP